MEKKILSNRIDGLQLIGDNLAISGIAKKHKLQDPSVINATIGTLYDEEGKFYKMKAVDETIRKFNDESIYTYSTADGGEDYQKAVINWVFGNEKEEIFKTHYAKSIATPGGTGAVNNAFYLALDMNEVILLPNLYWGPYKKMADVSKVNIENYEYIVNGKFNLKGFKEKAIEIANKQGKFVTVLNDPCNNPTGYSLSLEEFDEYIDVLNNLNCPCTLIFDIAYFDYYVKGMDECRKKFRCLTKANDNILINICFSASKTFSVYGLRLGAEIFLSKDKEVVDVAYEAATCLARTRWSNANKCGISLLTAIDKNPALKEQIINEIEEASEMTTKRIELFNKESKECGLDLYPVAGGFFMCIKCKDGFELTERLKDKKIYVLPFKNAIRLAICSITLNEVKGLAKRIFDTINEIK